MTESQNWRLLLWTALSGWVLYLLAPVLTPFLIGALLAYIGDPLVDRFEAWKLPRTLGVVIVFVLFSTVVLALLLILVPLLERQLALLISKLPGYAEWLRREVEPWLRERFALEDFHLDIGGLQQAITEHWRGASGAVTKVLASVSRSGLVLLEWLANLVLIPVVAFYLLRDWDILVAKVRELLPRRIEPVVSRLVQECDEVLAAFLRGQLMVMMSLGVIYATGLWIIGLEFALLIGLLAGMVSFVPYLGFIVGILVAGIAALMQFHDVWQLLPVAVVFAVGQALEGMLLTPLLVGNRIGLHPVAVIFAVLAGAQLFGFFGVLLALPVAAVVMVLVRHAHELYLGSSLYSDKSQS